MSTFLDRGSVPRRLLLALLLGLPACASDPEHPPEWKPPGDGAIGDPPRSCAQIRAGEPSGTTVLVDGAPAACAAAEMVCALGDVPAFAAVCDAGEALARCGPTLKWQLDCSASGSSDAGGPDADAAGDGATD